MEEQRVVVTYGPPASLDPGVEGDVVLQRIRMGAQDLRILIHAWRVLNDQDGPKRWTRFPVQYEVEESTGEWTPGGELLALNPAHIIQAEAD